MFTQHTEASTKDQQLTAKDNSSINYVIIDDVIEGQKNVASAVFADNEAAYLAGVAAAKTTKTKQVGFIDGIEGAVITRFEKGFEAGVKSVDPSIKIQVDYAGSFGDAAKGIFYFISQIFLFFKKLF